MSKFEQIAPKATSLVAEIEQVSTHLLKPRANNPRTHSPAQVKKIAKAVTKFGFTNPILIDEDNNILAGHGRLAAATSVWMNRVPCRRLINMSEAEKTAYALADNKLALDAGWDLAHLADNLSALEDLDFDLSLTGFDQSEIEASLVQKREESTHRSRAGEDEVPPLEGTQLVSQLGIPGTWASTDWHTGMRAIKRQ